MLTKQLRASVRRKRFKFLLSAEHAVGSGWHRFRTGPRCSLAEVAAFEARSGVSLPVDFKAVLTEVGNGCPGPYYGLSPLAAWCQPWQASEFESGLLSRPFDPAGPRERGLLHSGAMRVCNAGCEHYLLLVVAGPHAGEMWHDAAEDQLRTSPVLDSNGRRATFASWLSEWIEPGSNELLDAYWVARDFSGHALAQVIATATEPLTAIAVDQLPCPACVRRWGFLRPLPRVIVPVPTSTVRVAPLLNPKRAALLASRHELTVEPLQILPVPRRFLL